MRSPRDAGITPTLFRDGNALAAGLENIAGAAGGGVFRVQAGNGDFAFDRVLRENSAYYLLSVEVEPGDRDGRAHAIKVQVSQRGATVRSRAVVVIPKLNPQSARSSGGNSATSPTRPTSHDVTTNTTHSSLLSSVESCPCRQSS